MPRAQTRSELIAFGNSEFERLMKYADQYEEKNLLEKPVFDNRTIKDVLAHLYAWQELMIVWYEEGMKGLTPAIPAPGYTFKTAPELNEKLFQDYKDVPWAEMRAKLTKTHEKLIKIIEGHTEEELFTKKKYKWTGTTSMGCYFALAVPSHYVWAVDLLRKKMVQFSSGK